MSKPRGKGRKARKPEKYAYCPKCNTYSPKVIVVKDLSINKRELWCYLTCAHIVISDFDVERNNILETWYAPGSDEFEINAYLMRVEKALNKK